MDSIPQLIPKDLSKIPPVAVSEAGIFLTGYDQDNPPRLVRVPLDDLAKQDDLGPTAWGSVTDKPAVIAAGATASAARDVLGLNGGAVGYVAQAVLANTATYADTAAVADSAINADVATFSYNAENASFSLNSTSAYRAEGLDSNVGGGTQVFAYDEFAYAWSTSEAIACAGVSATWINLTGSLSADSVVAETFGGSLSGSIKFSASRTVAELPAASSSLGARYMVSNANATTFNSIVAGGGANKVPVFSDGTNWRIG